jgi:hypothetical protein
MRILPETRIGCGCLFGFVWLACTTFVGMCAILFAVPVPKRIDVFLCAPGLPWITGVFGALVSSVAPLMSPRRAATTGALIMSLPFDLVLVLSLLADQRVLSSGRLAGMAVSSAILGAVTGVLAMRAVQSVRFEPGFAGRRLEAPRLQLSLSSVLLTLVFAGALFSFLRVAYW